jgi:phosphoenolpyruvate-protein kinase (PTS system EI component)
MEIKKGIGVSPGVAISQAYVLDAEEYHITQRRIPTTAVDGELQRLSVALQASQEELVSLRDRTAKRLGAELEIGRASCRERV